MTDNLTPLLRALVSLIPPERKDAAFHLCGSWLVDNMPRRRRRKRRSGSGARKASAIVKFHKFMEAPLSEPSAGESEAEARVRIIGDAIARCQMFDATGLRFKTERGRDDSWTMQRHLEAMLLDARRDVKFARGDY